MLRSPAPSFSQRVAAAFLGALLCCGVAASAGAATPDGASQTSAVAEWKGRFCTATSCGNAPGSPLGAAASFGLAILAIRWMARRPAIR